MAIVARKCSQFSHYYLEAEYARLCDFPWISHPVASAHRESWFALPLLAVDGNPRNVLEKDGVFRPTPALRETQVFKTVFDFFKCPIRRARLFRLDAGGWIRRHTDDPHYPDVETVTIHIPILTNADVYFEIGSARLHMDVGECWYIDVRAEHAVYNQGPSERIHLVLHCAVGPFIEELLTDASIVVESDRETSA